MIRPSSALAFLLGLAIISAVAIAAQPAAMPWWQRGQDGWYYKDDWKGLYLSGARAFSKTIELPAAPRAAYIYVWGNSQTLRINGQVVGSDVDDGTIEDYDIASFLKPGANRIEVDAGAEFICEGAAVLPDSKEITFASDASWGPAEVKTSKERRTGPRGYSGDTHMARIVAVTAEQKAKVLVNSITSVHRRMRDADLYTFWKNRDVRELLDLAAPTSPRRQWQRIEAMLDEARPSIAAASDLILAGQFDRVEAAATPAMDKTFAAQRLLAELNVTARHNSARPLDDAVPRAAGPYLSHNRSDHNRLGWVTSCEPLDNDPAYWEFDLSPAPVESIALAGWWPFALDPENRGIAAGYAKLDFDDAAWTTIFAPTKWGWERWGHTAGNPNVRGANKPYNGYAWYRKSLIIPASWQGQDLLLRLGPRWGNVDWLAVNGQFVNDPAKTGSGADSIVIPARLVRFGQPNTLALRVLNADNIGGIINPGLRVSVAARELQTSRHIVGVGSARQTVYPTAAGPVTQIEYSSSLSPAVMVATSGRILRFGGWTARGFPTPRRCDWRVRGGIASIDLSTVSGPILEPVKLAANWLLLHGAAQGAGAPRPLLIVLETIPTSVDWVADGFGGAALDIKFAQAGARVVLLRPFDAADPIDDERCALWAEAMLACPVGYHEDLSFDGDICRVKLTYDYLEIKDDWQTRPLKLAPLPMLFSYAIENKWPGARMAGRTTDLGCRAQSLFYPGSDCGTYRAVIDSDTVTYAYDRMEPKVHLKGAGTFGEERRIGEQMYAKMRDWGFNCIRLPVALPKPSDYDNKERIAWVDQMIDFSRKNGLRCFINWFTDQSVPPARRQDFIDRWVTLAKHCRELPADDVVYDIINEPAGFAWDDYNSFMKQVTEAIRAVDKTHAISVEFGGGWAQPEDADMAVATDDPNTIYQFHFYGPHTDDVHRLDLWYPRHRPAEERFESYEGWEERMLSPIRFMIRNRCEVFHGEFGISFLGPDEAPRGWLEDVLAIHEKYRMHWNWWQYSGGDINRTGLMAGERENPLIGTLMRYAKIKAP